MGEDKGLMNRRTFVKATTAVAAGAAAAGIVGSTGVKAAKALDEVTPPEGAWYRTTCAPNCTGACGMKAFVRDGEIKMIRQAADYPYEHYNPRGCLKGLSINTLIHGPDRLLKPLVKTADGQVETDWDTALDTAAVKLREVMDKYGPESVGVIYQVQGTGHVQKGALVRIANAFGWSVIGGYELNGDLPMFWPETFGCQSEELESYCWEDSKLTLVFGSNIMVTRLPDAHFLNFARENGGRVVCLDPNYCATAEKADEWVRLAPDSDGMFALAMAKVIIDEKLYDEHFMKTYTDCPILINLETGKRILASEVAGLSVPGGIPEYRESYVAFDEASGQLVATTPLSLDDTDTFALDVERDVELADGRTVRAKSGWKLLVERLADYTPQAASSVCKVDAEVIERLAIEAATTKPTHIIFGGGTQQWHHGDLKGRACALVACLTGNIGKLGGGISTYVGQYKTRFKPASWFIPERYTKNSAPFHYAVNGKHAGMAASFPDSGYKALVVGWGNPLEQHNVANWLRTAVDEGDIECLVCLDFQQTLTVEKSTVAFPCASWYEKTELVTTPPHPWVQLMQPIVDAPGEAREEIWVFTELANRIDPSVEDLWPRFAPEDSEKRANEVLEMLLKNGGPTIEHITVDELRKGPGKLAHNHPGEKKIPFYEQIVGREPFPSISRPNDIEVTAKFVKSGRIEFYKDEDTFLELDEQLPCYKPPYEDTEYAADPTAREKYPLGYITRNSVFRVHATYTNNPFMLEMQSDTPKIFLNPAECRERGIEQGDWVEAYNSRGRVEGALIEDEGVYPGQCIFDQGWWSKYDNETSYNSLIYPWINPTHEVYYVPSVWSPNMAWNECVCNVRLLTRGGAEGRVVR